MVTAAVEVEEEINDCHHILLPYLMVRVRRRYISYGIYILHECFEHVAFEQLFREKTSLKAYQESKF